MQYRKKDTSYSLEKYTGNEPIVEVPVFHEQLEVTAIEAKAFLSCKSVSELILPETITEIGDWAFAHMKNLKKLTLPAKAIHFGNNVFLDCEQLTQIFPVPDDSGNEGTASFLASAVTFLNNISLCRPELAGSEMEHKSWMEDYDTALAEFITASDEMGFEPVFFGWFDVDDIDVQKQRFVSKRWREKTLVAFQRLLYPKELGDDTRNILCQYLTSHMPEGSLAYEHTIPFTMLCEEYENDVRYIKLVADMGYINNETFPLLMEGLRDAGAEVVAFLLRYQQTELTEADFFAGLSL